MADFDPDIYLAPKQSDSGSFDPDSYLGSMPPEPADHGLSERQKLSPVGKALSPVASYPETYKRMRGEAGEQVSEGLHQITHPDSLIDPKAHGLSDVLSGAAKTAIGAAGFVASPVSAAYRSIVGQPLEDVTGIPREYTEFASQLATPGIGLTSLKAKPNVPTIPKPAAPAGTGPFKTVLTEGEQTGDLALRQAEQGAIRGQAGKPAQEHAEEFLNVARPQQLAEDKDFVVKSLDPVGGQELATNPAEAANLAQQSLQKEAARSKAQVKSLYDRAKALPGEIDADTFTDMPQDIKADLSNRAESVIIDDNTPVASRMINYLDNQIGQLRIKNLAEPATPQGQIVGVNLEGVEQWRKNLSKMRGDAIAAYHTNPSDARAARAIIDEFDSRISDAVNSGAFRGDLRAVDYYNQARAAHSARMQTWGNDAVGRRLQAIVGDIDRDPASLNDVANYIYSGSGTSPNSLNIGVAKRIKNILGESSPEWAAIKQGLFHRLVSTAENVADRGAGTVANRLGEFVNGKGSDLANVVFSPAERDLLNQYAELHRKLSVPQVAANWPNTAAGVIPHIKAATDKILGVVGAFIGHHIAPVVGGFVGYKAGEQISKVLDKAENARNLRQIANQMPLLSQRLKQWQQAVKAQQRVDSVANQSRRALAATNVSSALGKLGIDNASTMRLLQAGPSGPGTSEAGSNDQRLYVTPTRAEGGRVGDDYNTFLTPEQETGFQTWKQQNAPDDSGVDYDLRGAYLANMRRSADNGHMGDLFKKPNHPTFSDQSQYATGDQRDRAGFWIGPEGPDQTFVPPANKRSGGKVRGYEDGGAPTADQERLYVSPSDRDVQQGEGKSPDVIGDMIVQAHDRLATQPARLPPATDNSEIDQKLLPDIQELSPVLNKLTEEGSFSKGTKIGNRLVGAGGEGRYQTWPERMIRSGGSLPHDVMTGQTPTQIVNPETGEVVPNPEMLERAQDMAGMAGGAGLTTGVEGGAAALGSAPFLRPALKYNNKIYKAPVGGQHLDAIPPEIYPEFQRQAMNGEDISNFNFGFMNHKGQFLNRDAAMDYAVKEGLIDPHAASQKALTSTILEDSALPGAPLAALEHAPPFYSAVEQTIAKAPQQKMHGEQWANWLKNQPGVKPDELQYTGIDNWLREQKGPITKQQVADYIDKNKVQVNDVVKGQSHLDELKLQRAVDRYMDDWEEDFKNEQGRRPTHSEGSDQRAYVEQMMRDDPDSSYHSSNTVKYSSYQLPGGKNYREHLLTLPDNAQAVDKQIKDLATQYDNNREKLLDLMKDPDFKTKHFDTVMNMIKQNEELSKQRAGLVQKRDEQRTQNYKSSHWDEPNVVAHVRTNDRDVGGVPALHLEELQSDFAQSHRKQAKIVADYVDKNFDDLAAKMLKDGVIKKECD